MDHDIHGHYFMSMESVGFYCYSCGYMDVHDIRGHPWISKDAGGFRLLNMDTNLELSMSMSIHVDINGYPMAYDKNTQTQKLNRFWNTLEMLWKT